MRKKVYQILILLGILIAYYCIVRYTGHGIPCLFYAITGYQCPGCGITRMIMAIMKGQWRLAYHYNQYLFVTFPYLVYIIGKTLWKWFKDDNTKMGKTESVLLFFYFMGLLIFGIWRNIAI